MVLKIGQLKIAFFLLVFPFFSSCTANSSGETSEYSESDEKPVPTGEALYVMHCESCHGTDGAKGYSGAANLAESKMSDSKIESTILHGNNKGMMPYEDLIESDEQLKSLVDFVKTLRK